jgi:hypothetical protein
MNMTINPNDIIGILGLCILLTGFCIVQIKKYSKKTFVFNYANLIGSTLLGIYAYTIGSFVFLALQIIWAIIATVFLIKYFTKK